MSFKWNPEDRYSSNNGKGPIMARIVDATDQIVTLEKWDATKSNPRKNTFPLSLKFFTSDDCGWKRIEPK